MSVNSRLGESNVRCGLYARVSTDDKGQNPESQLQPLREYCTARQWQAVEYVDHAGARDLRNRRHWRQLMEDARRRRIDRVLVWKLDRAFRSVLDATTQLRQLEEHGVTFTVLTQPIDTASATGRLTFHILCAVAEMERELIAERTKAGLARARRAGKQLGRPNGSKDKRQRRRSGYLLRYAATKPVR